MRNTCHNNPQRDDEGVVALEFVLILPVLVALLIAIASFGAYFNKKIDVTSAARDAARTLALGKPLTGADAVPTDMTASNVFPCVAGDPTKNASVTLTASYTFSIPFLLNEVKTITATGTMRCGG